MLPSGEPALRALVTLRDPEGAVAERTVATDDQGRFEFTGLPETDRLVLFAAVQREGSTYSRRISGVRSGETGLDLELQTEDPIPPDRRKRGKPTKFGGEGLGISPF